MLTQTEANTLAKAGVEVLKLYEVDLAPEAVAWGNLIIAGASIYAPKIIAAQMRAKAERARNVTPQPPATFHSPAPAPMEVAPEFARAEAPGPGNPGGADPKSVQIGPDHYR